MNHQIESLVEYYLTQNGTTGIFLCPQYRAVIRSAEGKETGAAEPDFVALDFKTKEIIVVEVSIASSISKLTEKIMNRKNNWFDPVVRQLETDGVIPQFDKAGKEVLWKTRFIGFVRLKEPAVAKTVSAFSGDDPQVKFVDVENALLAYKYWGEKS